MPSPQRESQPRGPMSWDSLPEFLTMVIREPSFGDSEWTTTVAERDGHVEGATHTGARTHHHLLSEKGASVLANFFDLQDSLRIFPQTGRPSKPRSMTSGNPRSGPSVARTFISIAPSAHVTTR